MEAVNRIYIPSYNMLSARYIQRKSEEKTMWRRLIVKMLMMC